MNTQTGEATAGQKAMALRARMRQLGASDVGETQLLAAIYDLQERLVEVEKRLATRSNSGDRRARRGRLKLNRRADPGLTGAARRLHPLPDLSPLRACGPGDVSAGPGPGELPGAAALHQVRRPRRGHPHRVVLSVR